MKFFAAIVLFLCQSVYAAESWTPASIKAGVNADVFYQGGIALAMGIAYTSGVVQSIKTIQNLGYVPKLICFPSDGSVLTTEAINALDPAGFPNTTQGGTLYIYSALLAKYPCNS